MSVREARAGDVDALVDVLAAVRAASGGGYPPGYVAGSREGLRAWIAGDGALDRLVAVDAAGTVCGHVAVHDRDHLDADIARWLGAADRGLDGERVLELSRLFVDPRHRGAGAGGRLVDAATAAIERRGGMPILCVMEGQTDAERLYRRAGWREAGEIVGVSGRLNRILVGPGR